MDTPKYPNFSAAFKILTPEQRDLVEIHLKPDYPGHAESDRRDELMTALNDMTFPPTPEQYRAALEAFDHLMRIM
jgi:hypothetical protein